MSEQPVRIEQGGPAAKPSGTERARELDHRLEAQLASRADEPVHRVADGFELGGGARIRIEWAAGAAFMCVDTPPGAPLRAHWIPTEVSRFRDEALATVVDDALRRFKPG